MEAKKRAPRSKAATIDVVATEEPPVAAEPKKKSRAKKATTIVEEITPALTVEEMPAPSVAKKPTSRSAATRKPPIVATVTPDGIIGSLTTSEPRPLIAHLPIRMSDLQNDLFGGSARETRGTVAGSSSENPTGGGSALDATSSNGSVMPFDASMRLAEFNTDIAPSATLPVVKEPTTTRPLLPVNYSEKLMIRYLDSNREQRLPDTTEVACFWDKHPFHGTPCVIPLKIEEDIWLVYGNFCCPECAAAYLFNEPLDSHVKWERFALLNRLYTGGDVETVRLAAPWTVLRLFGGNLDITEYRELVADKRMRIDVSVPPMISITQVMDTKPIDFYDASVKNTFIPWEMDRMNRPGAQGLRLRRTKPIARKEATLEWCMGIKT